jgi:anti-sigma B factor antagonist
MDEFGLDIAGPVGAGPDGSCAILRVAGEVDVYTAPMMREQIHDLAAKGTVHVIADLSRVEFIDSTGLGALIGGLKRVREDGGWLALVISTPRILRVFQLTGLTRVFDVHGTVAEAVSADPYWRQTTEADAGSAEAWCQRHHLS